jgi:hypothetical protein
MARRSLTKWHPQPWQADPPSRSRKQGRCLLNPYPLLLRGALRSGAEEPPAWADSRGRGNRAGGGEGLPEGWGSKAPPILQILDPLSATVLHGDGCRQRRGD